MAYQVPQEHKGVSVKLQEESMSQCSKANSQSEHCSDSIKALESKWSKKMEELQYLMDAWRKEVEGKLDKLQRVLESQWNSKFTEYENYMKGKMNNMKAELTIERQQMKNAVMHFQNTNTTNQDSLPNLILDINDLRSRLNVCTEKYEMEKSQEETCRYKCKALEISEKTEEETRTLKTSVAKLQIDNQHLLLKITEIQKKEAQVLENQNCQDIEIKSLKSQLSDVAQSQQSVESRSVHNEVDSLGVQSSRGACGNSNGTESSTQVESPLPDGFAELLEQVRNMTEELKETRTAGENLAAELSGLKAAVQQREEDFQELHRAVAECRREVTGFGTFLAEENVMISALWNEQLQEIKRLKETRQVQSHTHQPGRLLWRIPEFESKLLDAKENKTILDSPIFYSAEYGYKLKLEVYLNGLGQWTGRHMIVSLKVLDGEWDALLPWPFSHKVSVTIRDQSEGLDQASILVKSFSGRNEDIFIPHSVLRQFKYVKKDVIFLDVNVA